MPFQYPSASRSPRPDGPPLISAGGLFPSRSGKALVGSINLDYVDTRVGTPVSTQLLNLIDQCLKEKRQLRVLIFEQFQGRVPYTLNFTIGETPDEREQRLGSEVVENAAQEHVMHQTQTPPQQTVPPTPNDGPWADAPTQDQPFNGWGSYPSNEQQSNPSSEQSGEPTPRPMRRGAPRR